MSEHYNVSDIGDIHLLQVARNLLSVPLNDLYKIYESEEAEELRDSLKCRAIAAADKNILLESFRRRDLGTSIEEVISNARGHIPTCYECSANYETFLESFMYEMLEATARVKDVLYSNPSFRRIIMGCDREFLNILEGGN